MVSGLALHSATNCQQKATGLGPCLVLHTLIQFRCFWNFEVKKGFWPPKTQWFEWKKPAFFTTRRVAVAPENLCFSDSKLLDAHGHKRCFRISLCRSHPRFRLQHPPERSHMFLFFFFSLAKDSTDLLIGGGNSGFSTTVRVTRVDGEQLSLPRDLPETHVS